MEIDYPKLLWRCHIVPILVDLIEAPCGRYFKDFTVERLFQNEEEKNEEDFKRFE